MTHHRKKKVWDPDAVVANSERPKSNPAAELVNNWTAEKIRASFLRMFAPAKANRVQVEATSLRRIGRNWRRTWVKPHQGEQECARRRRQIAAGILNEANGLLR